MLQIPRKSLQTLAMLVVVLVLPATALGNHQDIAHLATQLNLATSQLAYDLRGSGAYSSIRQQSERLSREAAQLVEAVRKNRSQNHVRAQFRDVSQRFASLEQAFLRLNRRDYDPALFNELDRISGLYNTLNAEFRYTGGYAYEQPYQYNPPVIIYQQIPAPGYGIPRGFVNPQPQFRQEQYERRDRRDYGRRQVFRQMEFDHRSPVLDRQLRHDNNRQDFDQGRRGGRTETSRRNHYE